MAGCVKRKPLVDSRLFRPRLEQNVDMRRRGQVEHRILCRLLAPFGHPPQRFGRERQINRFFGLLHHNLQPILPVIRIDVSPFQAYYIAYPQSAEAGEQISLFYRLVLHRSSDQCPKFLDSHILPLAFGTVYLIRVTDFRKGIQFDYVGTDSGVQRSVQHPIIVLCREFRDGLSLRTVFRQKIVDISLTKGFVHLLHSYPFPCIVFQYLDSDLNLVSVLFAAFLLVLHVGIHPIQQ